MVHVICEALMLEESLEAYAFIMLRLAEMEPLRALKNIKIIYGDCKVTETLIPMIKINPGSIAIVWDHYQPPAK
jgi:hypothetical protein